MARAPADDAGAVEPYWACVWRADAGCSAAQCTACTSGRSPTMPGPTSTSTTIPATSGPLTLDGEHAIYDPKRLRYCILHRRLARCDVRALPTTPACASRRRERDQRRRDPWSGRLRSSCRAARSQHALALLLISSICLVKCLAGVTSLSAVAARPCGTSLLAARAASQCPAPPSRRRSLRRSPAASQAASATVLEVSCRLWA